MRGMQVSRCKIGLDLCVRKAELILVRNFSDNSKDESTVRISAQAQRAVRRNNLLIGQDADVTPFVKFWTFGRLDNEWKLKEVLPPAKGPPRAANWWRRRMWMKALPRNNSSGITNKRGPIDDFTNREY